uniref:Translation initiation factor 2 n=1 Tax=Nemalion vermiculare TaxID=935621 RepID=UPI002579C796|nr:Translation initiation factor 2 [Nemalion vermiculare]WGV34307.1 Translation initiation factor 2 [Nemalion vermiculare]
MDNPKLICDITNKHSNHLEVTNSITETLTNTVENGNNNRTDKRNKVYNKSIDLLESKKNKVKTKKKIRSKVHINDEDDSLNNRHNNLSKTDKNLELSLMRPTRPLKKREVGNSDKLKAKVSQKKEDIIDTSTKNISNVDSKIEKVTLTNPLSIQELSNLLSIPAPEIIKSLFLQGIPVTINQVVDIAVAQSVATTYGIDVSQDAQSESDTNIVCSEIGYEKKQQLEPRAPIVTIFGHVDHGKTTLMNAITQTKTLSVESGGITQTIVAHEVVVKLQNDNNKIIFLDTPGHEAFSDMRLRSMQVTDIGILVVAADDGLKVQTKEAINYLYNHQIPFIVAINKVDKAEAQIHTIMQELSTYNIIPEIWGGDVPTLQVSGLKNINVDQLLSTILTVAKGKNLLADPLMPASGTVLDAYLDKHQGPLASLLIQRGTLRQGDYIITDQVVSKIRSLVSKSNEKIKSSGPSSIVSISGLESIPVSGHLFKVIDDERIAKKQLVEYQKNKDKGARNYKRLNNRVTFDLSRKANNKIRTKIINIILKTDSEGTIDAIINAFTSIPQNKVQINIISAGVGDITASDINLAGVSQATIISFNNFVPAPVKRMISNSTVLSLNFTVIYDLMDYIKTRMLELVETEYAEQITGTAIVEGIFTLSKGVVAGCVVVSGKLKRNSYIKVKRNQEVIHSGELHSLKRIKEDVDEVSIKHECGVMSADFDRWQRKDLIEAYDLIAQDKTL